MTTLSSAPHSHAATVVKNDKAPRTRKPPIDGATARDLVLRTRRRLFQGFISLFLRRRRGRRTQSARTSVAEATTNRRHASRDEASGTRVATLRTPRAATNFRRALRNHLASFARCPSSSGIFPLDGRGSTARSPRSHASRQPSPTLAREAAPTPATTLPGRRSGRDRRGRSRTPLAAHRSRGGHPSS